MGFNTRAVASIEGQFAKATGKLVTLSEQKYLDCVSHNCSKGGWQGDVFNYARTDGGLPKDTIYPYVGKEQECHNNKSQNIAADSGYMTVSRDEQTIKSALFEIGPLAVSLFASNHFRYNYTKDSGVYRDDPCSDQKVNHGVLLVGYGVDEKEGPFWLIKNSWGVEWGERGYVRLERSSRNVACLMSQQPIYPIVAAPAN
ncbi:unnamed protein product, partial [Mesorhabditis belari]|uniref:Peptidase C1A papain C-terminal domain-containing protein n=1 Tax=Mesorhabditis belari TaxID=2138241 RepID=A0AAF3J3R5_9BILA